MKSNEESMKMINELLHHNLGFPTPPEESPKKGDVYIRRSDKVFLYICGTCVSMNEGEEGEKQVVYIPLHGPYDTLYTMNIKNFNFQYYRFLSENLDLKEALIRQFDNIDELLNPNK